jgi:predicted metal-binding membrane protein
MTPEAHERRTVLRPLLAASTIAWVAVAAAADGIVLPAFCAGGAPSALPLLTIPTPTMPTTAAIDLALAMNPPATLAAGWALMLAAMMLPLLGAPVRHVRARSLTRRRARSVALFLMGYALVWMAAGAALLAVALALRLALPGSPAPLIAALVVAVVWQISPLKQRCLNRCHARPSIAAFGAAADRDALHFGVTQGVWCCGACWALMLLPLLVAQGHFVAMAAVAMWLAGERLSSPMPPVWRLRWPDKALRLIFVRVHAKAGTRFQFR